MRVRLYQLDGKLPNVALMRIAHHCRARGDSAELRRPRSAEDIQPELGEPPDLVYGSAIFQKSRPLVDALFAAHPHAIVGGTGIDLETTLEDELEITSLAQDYTLWPEFTASIGFTQRGCRLRCPFCVVPGKEGRVREEQTIAELWRGEPWPRDILLLDNDFFGQPGWRDRMAELVSGGFRVSFSQGINARLVDAEIAESLARVNYRDDGFQRRQLYTAWDNRKDERRLFRGLELLVAAGIKPAHLMVYVLIGYWTGETHEDRDYRRAKLREFGAVPYPMPYTRTPELVGFQRWCVTAADKYVPWEDFQAAHYRPETVSIPAEPDRQEALL